MTDGYIELHAASAFSFLGGGSLPESLVECAAHLDMGAMALLDRNGVYGSARFHLESRTLRRLRGRWQPCGSYGQRRRLR